ncbi:hypothetical protein QR721_10210 [Aciduricibacillus chroicocephali]|uniref:Uncharacterized protein n=1 Tax=Aciduricibacillus chroicocephali TaxID=3054939 RepID=A0ABY9KTZ1_9BACI|nr:hypothetical protein QR721_10210 [Bacillaceae bacterium 44XB]
MEKRKRTVFYRNKYFWIILIIAAIILWSLSTVISGRRASLTNNLNSMPATEQHITVPSSDTNINL